MGVTFTVLGCSKTSTTTAAAIRTTATARASGSQLRSRAWVGGERSRSGPVLTSEILHPLPKEYSGIPHSCYLSYAFSPLTDSHCRRRILFGFAPFSGIPSERTASQNQERRKQAPLLIRNACQKALKGRPTMQPSPQTASTSLPALHGMNTPSQRRKNLCYQVMTIAAMLVLLCSLWVF